MTLVSSFIGPAYEGISRFLHHKQNNALHKAVQAMDDKANVQCNKLMKLDNSMLMYGIYNDETLEKLIKTVHRMHNTTSFHERLQVNISSLHSGLFTHTLQAYNTILQIHFYI